MTPTGAHLEEALETTIEAHLLTHGWHQGANTSYNRGLSLDTVELFTFIGATQLDGVDREPAVVGGVRALVPAVREQVRLDRRLQRLLQMRAGRGHAAAFPAGLSRCPVEGAARGLDSAVCAR